MLDRIRQEVERRHSTISLKSLDHVLAAMDGILGERFVDEADKKTVYETASLNIGISQAISEAYIVAIMSVAANLNRDTNLLDVGTSSQYQAASLAGLAHRITSVEIVPELTKQARARLMQLGRSNVEVRPGRGTGGWPASARFDAIVVYAGTLVIPPAPINQLEVGGRLIIPVGPAALEEELLVITKLPNALDECSLGPARFVPMTGRVRTIETTQHATPERSKIRMCFGVPVT